jgi:hypothetical protein
VPVLFVELEPLSFPPKRESIGQILAGIDEVDSRLRGNDDGSRPVS